ncbi:MAG: MFS transporter [Acidobacteriota bacterium]
MSRSFWTYFAATLFFNFGFSLFFFLFNVYLLGVGYNEQTIGLIGSCALAGRLLAILPIGWLAQRFGLRSTLFFAVATAVVATFGRVAFTSHAAQFALATLAGISLAAWGVCLAPAVAAFTTEARRPLAFSLIFAAGIGDAGIGAYAAGHLPAFASQRVVLCFGVAVAALSLLPLALLKLEAQVLSPRPSIRMPRSPFLRRFLLATAVWAVVLGAFPPFANVFFTHHLHLPLAQMGTVLSISQAVQLAAILLAPALSRRMSLPIFILVTQLLTAASLFTLGGAHTLEAAAFSYWFYTAAQNSNEPAIASMLMNRVDAADRNAASSFALLSTAATQIVASAAVGAGIVHLGYSPVLYSIAALALVAALLFYQLPTNES